MAPQRHLCSTSKASEDPEVPKGNKTLLGGSENPLAPKSWANPNFFEDYLFDKTPLKSFHVCNSDDPPLLVYSVLDHLLLMDIDLKQIPRVVVSRGDFALVLMLFSNLILQLLKDGKVGASILKNPTYMSKLQQVQLFETILAFSTLDISKDASGLMPLLCCWNSQAHTFFTHCGEIAPSLENVVEILRLPLFGDNDVSNI